MTLKQMSQPTALNLLFWSRETRVSEAKHSTFRTFLFIPECCRNFKQWENIFQFQIFDNFSVAASEEFKDYAFKLYFNGPPLFCHLCRMSLPQDVSFSMNINCVSQVCGAESSRAGPRPRKLKWSANNLFLATENFFSQ